ncbi:MAG: SCO family protein [Proteobacteria bacterium]|nr:SCO family protein [Pseudomonadota bacterium]
MSPPPVSTPTPTPTPTPTLTKGIGGRRLLFGLLVVFLIAVVPSVIVPTLMCRQPDPVLDDLGELPPTIALIDERGAPIDRAAFLHHATIVSFIFTRCDTICPVTSMKFSRMQDHLFDVAHRVKLLSISVDPTYDTPERLLAYAQRFHAEPKSWRFATGQLDEIRRLVEGTFADSMERRQDLPSGVPNLGHNGYFVLVDPAGHLRGFYDSRDIGRLDQLEHDARFLSRTMK